MRLFTNLGIDNNYSQEQELLNLSQMKKWHKDIKSYDDELVTFDEFLSRFVEIDSKTGIGYFTSNVRNNKYKLTVKFDNCKNKQILDYSTEMI